MERPGGECNASDCRTQQIDQDLKECVTRACGGGWLASLLASSERWPKREQVCFESDMQNIT